MRGCLFSPLPSYHMLLLLLAWAPRKEKEGAGEGKLEASQYRTVSE